MSNSGKSHLTKLFILDVLRDVETNPKAKLIVYEPKREFYAWMSSLGLTHPIAYFMPSDERSVALDFSHDYKDLVDAYTLAQAFFPVNPKEHQPFFSESVRTICGQLYHAIKQVMGYSDLRLLCLLLEDKELTEKVLGYNPYFVQAQELIAIHGGSIDKTTSDIFKTIHSRIAKMKIIAAQMEKAREKVGLFSIRDFLEKPGTNVLVVSKDSKYKETQDPLNGVLFLRLIDLLDGKQQDEDRKVFIVIDEFPTLAGDLPCPGITDMFLRLRSRGVTILITYQAHTTLRRIYGDTVTEFLGQCTNVIYLKQSDSESAKYAAEDLGLERGYETKESVSYGSNDWTITKNPQWFDRTIHAATYLMNELKPASQDIGIEGVAKSPQYGPKPWHFPYPHEFIDRIPRTNTDLFAEYEERPPEDQWLRRLGEDELRKLRKEDNIESEEERCTRLLDR